MKFTLSVLLSFFLLVVIQSSIDSCRVFAQSSEGQITGHEFTKWQPEGFSDSQFSLLWNAYNLKSDSLLAKFFTNWRLETQILQEPALDSPISNATASLFVFLLNKDFQNSDYPYGYAVIQDQVDATVSYPSWSSENGYSLIDFHPQSSNPDGPKYVLLDDRHNALLGEFLGDWSVVKAQAAQQFFGGYVPFGADVYYYNKQADWSLMRHWYSFQFTSDLQQAFVTDETPTGEINYTCIIGPDGTWIKVANDAVILGPSSPSEPPDVPYYPPADFPPYPHPHHPPHGPDPIQPAGGTILPTPVPEPPVGRPRTIATPTHTTNPTAPADPGRPRTNPPPEHNPVSPPFYQPVSPQNPSQPARHRANSPSSPQPNPPQQTPVERQRANPPSPQPPKPAERPRTVQPAPSSSPAAKTTLPESPQKSSPPPDKKDQDQKKERGR